METAPKEMQQANELLEKLAEYKPLAKIEEMEEQNYNMVDNVLNNGCMRLSIKKQDIDTTMPCHTKSLYSIVVNSSRANSSSVISRSFMITLPDSLLDCLLSIVIVFVERL